MQYIFLSDSFYNAYNQSAYPEIEHKRDRPYAHVVVSVGKYDFAVPLRSHIKHDHVLWTDKANGCGLDFTKTIVLLKPDYIDTARKPHLRQNEFDVLRGQDYVVKQRLMQYIREYKKAKRRLDVPRNARLCSYSTLQYFERYI